MSWKSQTKRARSGAGSGSVSHRCGSWSIPKWHGSGTLVVGTVPDRYIPTIQYLLGSLTYNFVFKWIGGWNFLKNVSKHIWTVRYLLHFSCRRTKKGFVAPVDYFLQVVKLGNIYSLTDNVMRALATYTRNLHPVQPLISLSFLTSIFHKILCLI